MSIFIIQSVTTNFDHDYPETSYEVEQDAGYFTDEAEANRYADERTDAENKSNYDGYVKAMNASHARNVESYVDRKAAASLMEKSGLNPSKFFSSWGLTEPKPPFIQDFESYCKDGGVFYEVLTFEPNRGN